MGAPLSANTKCRTKGSYPCSNPVVCSGAPAYPWGSVGFLPTDKMGLLRRFLIRISTEMMIYTGRG